MLKSTISFHQQICADLTTDESVRSQTSCGYLSMDIPSIMRNGAKLAIIIPVYNTARYVDEMMQDLLNQTFRDFLIFLIDDGSIDNSLAILSKFAAKDKRVHVLSKPNGGPSSARNVGLDFVASEGMQFDYIWFCDSDDRIELSALEKVMTILECAEADYGLFSVCKFDKNASTTYPAHIFKEEVLDNEAIVKQYFRFGRKWRKEPCSEAFLNNKIFRFDLIQDLRFREDIRRSEDFDFFFRLLPRLQHGVLVPDVFYMYRLRKSSLTNAYEQTGDLIVCSTHYPSLKNRTCVEQVAMQHRLIRAYYLDICQAWNTKDESKFQNLLLKFSKLKLNYPFMWKDLKILALLGPLKVFLPMFIRFRNRIKKNRDVSNYYD